MNQVAKSSTEYLSLSAFGRLVYKVKNFFKTLFLPMFTPQDAIKKGKVQKASVIGSYFLTGFWRLTNKLVGSGILLLAVEILYILYMIFFGGRHITGKANLDYLNLQAVSIVLTVVFLYIHIRGISDAVINAKNDYYKDAKDGALIAFFKNIAKGFNNFGERAASIFKSGTKKQKAAMTLAYVFFGVPQILTGQIVKGIIFFALEVLFVVYMILAGVSQLGGIVTLKVANQVSHFTLLYGLIAIFICLMFVGLYVINLTSALKNIEVQLSGKQNLTFKQEIKSYAGKKFYIILLSIPVVGALAFTVLPLLFMILLAFTDYGTSGTIPQMNIKWLSWTGFDSFKSLFSMGQNLKTLVNVFGWTIIWAVLATFTCYIGGILLAVLINKKVIKCKIVFRSIFILTMAIPQFVTLRVMYTMFNEYGPINTLLLNWGWITQRYAFWENELSAKTLIIIINMWVGIPYFMMLMSGLLMNIPADLYESAKIEGAGKFYTFRKITMPYLLFMTTPLIITNFVGNINNFNVIWLLTGGGPMGQGTGGVAGATDILITWLFKLTMQNHPEYNLGAAIGIIMFIVSATLSLVVFRRSSSYKREEEFS